MEHIESWKNYHNYLVSDLGRVMNRKGKIINPHDDQRGYLRYVLYIDGKRQGIKAHYLVMKCFVGDRPCDPKTNKPLQIDHINRDRYDNKLINLRYVTPKQNARNKQNYHADILEEDPTIRNKLIRLKKKSVENI